MQKKLVSLALCLVCLLSIAVCAQAEDTGYLAQISGTYVELFPVLSKEEYRPVWLEVTGELVGEENAGDVTDMLLAMCMADIYGDEAAAQYAEDPESMRFDCYFLGGVSSFVIDGSTITGLDADGNQVFSHSYAYQDVENENGFIFYKTEDADAGQFTWFAFSPDTMEETYHLEFRYAEDQEDLMSWFEGNYAYWNAAGIAADSSEETITNCITLFATENLSEEEAA